MPAYDFRTPRIYLGADLRLDGLIAASPGQANYLLNVLRMGDGDSVLAFNGHDGEWHCVLVQTGKKKFDFKPVERVRPQTHPPDLIYGFAPLKHARLDYMVQKAVEMGAGILQPVVTQHTQSSRLNVDRMRANAVEAAEQCGILSVPDCREPLKLDAFLASWDEDRLLIVCDERKDAASPIDVLAALPQGPKALLVGPEGGFSPQERERLAALPYAITISLGPRILRADTAAVAALAVLQAAAGDWRSG